MVDTHVSGACGAIRRGSSPLIDIFAFFKNLNFLYTHSSLTCRAMKNMFKKHKLIVHIYHISG